MKKKKFIRWDEIDTEFAASICDLNFSVDSSSLALWQGLYSHFMSTDLLRLVATRRRFRILCND